MSIGVGAWPYPARSEGGGAVGYKLVTFDCFPLHILLMAVGIALRARAVVIHPLYGCIITDLCCLTFEV